MTDQVAVRGLRVRGFHGVLAEERRDGQDFVVDAVLELDTSAAAAIDDLALTVTTPRSRTGSPRSWRVSRWT